MATLQEQRERRAAIEGELSSLSKTLAERRSQKKSGQELWTAEDQSKFDTLTTEHSKLVSSIEAEERAANLESYLSEAEEKRNRQLSHGRPNPRLTDPIPGNPADAEFGEYFSSRDAARQHQIEERAKAFAFQAWASKSDIRDESAKKLAMEKGFLIHGDRFNYRSVDDEAHQALRAIMAGDNTAEHRSQYGQALREWEQRSILMEPNRANFIPQGFRDAFEMAFAGKGSIFPLIDYVITDDAETIPFPFVDDTANKGRRVNEAAVDPQTEVDPEIVIPRLGTIEFDSGFAKINSQLIERSPFNLVSMLGTVLGERLIRAMDEEAIIGPGTTGRFRGLANKAATGKTSAAAGAVAIANVQDLVLSVIMEHRENGTLLLSDPYFAGLLKLVNGQGDFLVSLANGRLDIGKNISVAYKICNWLPQTFVATGKPIYFGNFKQVKARVTRDVPVQRFNEIFSANNLTGFKANRAADLDMVRGSSDVNCPVKCLVLS